jgi:serine/threonine-protein kinase
VNVTKTGAVMGTPTYMSPEQCRGVAVDHRADLYALGCVVFELCCGRPPFLGEGSGDVLAAHIHMPPPTLTRLGVEVPPAFEQLVGRLLTKPPAARVQSADELIRAIDALTVEPAAAVSLPSGGPRPVTESPSMTTLSGASTSRLLPSALTSNQRRSVAIVASVAATLTVAVVAVVMLRSGEAPPAAHAGPPSKGAPAPSPVPIEPAPRTAVASPPVARAPEPTAVVTPGSAAAAPPPSVSIAPDPAPAEPTPEPTRPAMSKLDKPTRPEPARPTMPKVEKPTRPEPDKPMTSPSPIRSTPPRNIERSQPANVELAIETTPPGAQVLLAGKGLGKTPFHGYLPRGDGNVTLVVRLSGYIDRTVVVHPDRAIRERVKLVPARGKRDQSVNPF